MDTHCRVIMLSRAPLDLLDFYLNYATMSMVGLCDWLCLPLAREITVTDTPASKSAGMSGWDLLGWLLAGAVVFVLILFLVGFVRGAWDLAGQFTRPYQPPSSYSSAGGTRNHYAPSRVECIPQRQPQGAWRCEVGGRPGWCR